MTPHLTVAAVVERDGRFLFVEERADGLTVLNQPAGHVEDRESFVDAVVREMREETGWAFAPDALVGVYRWRHPGNGHTFIRAAFAGTLGERVADGPLDPDIIACHWLARAELARWRLRSPLVERCVEDWSAGVRYPLGILIDVE